MEIITRLRSFYSSVGNSDNPPEESSGGKNNTLFKQLTQYRKNCINGEWFRNSIKWILQKPQYSVPLTFCLLAGSLTGIMSLCMAYKTLESGNQPTPTPTPTPTMNLTQIQELEFERICYDKNYTTIFVITGVSSINEQHLFHINEGKYSSEDTGDHTLISNYDNPLCNKDYQGNYLNNNEKQPFPTDGSTCIIKHKKLKEGYYFLYHSSDNGVERMDFEETKNNTCKWLNLTKGFNKNTFVSDSKFREDFVNVTRHCYGYLIQEEKAKKYFINDSNS